MTDFKCNDVKPARKLTEYNIFVQSYLKGNVGMTMKDAAREWNRYKALITKPSKKLIAQLRDEEREYEKEGEEEEYAKLFLNEKKTEEEEEEEDEDIKKIEEEEKEEAEENIKKIEEENIKKIEELENESEIYKSTINPSMGLDIEELRREEREYEKEGEEEEYNIIKEKEKEKEEIYSTPGEEKNELLSSFGLEDLNLEDLNLEDLTEDEEEVRKLMHDYETMTKANYNEEDMEYDMDLL